MVPRYSLRYAVSQALSQPVRTRGHVCLCLSQEVTFTGFTCSGNAMMMQARCSVVCIVGTVSLTIIVLQAYICNRLWALFRVCLVINTRQAYARSMYMCSLDMAACMGTVQRTEVLMRPSRVCWVLCIPMQRMCICHHPSTAYRYTSSLCNGTNTCLSHASV